MGIPGLSQYECYYETSHEYFPGPTIGTITLSLDFFVPPISLRINMYLDMLPTFVMLCVTYLFKVENKVK